MECKQIDLGKAFCSESALDGVSKLVAKGFNITKACEVVAEQYAENYPDEAPKSAKQLRKKFYDAQKVDKPTKVKKTKLVPLDVPMINSTTECIVDTTKYVPIELYTEAQKRIKQLEEAVESMLPYVDKAMSFETVPDPAPEKSTLLPRQIVYDFIKQKGNTIQCHALKSDDLSNDKLYSIFVKVREDYKTSTPPPAWDMEIINATGIL